MKAQALPTLKSNIVSRAPREKAMAGLCLPPRLGLRWFVLASAVLMGAVPAHAQPLPPTRPSALSPGPAAASTNAAPDSAPARGGVALSEAEALAKINAYLNSFRTLQGNFIQFGADGRRYEGQLYLSRPGRIRFAYKPPATIEVVADGTSVAVRDRKLATQDLYTIGQTPLKFLLRDKIDLAGDLKVVKVASTAEVIRIALEDKSTLGGTSRITLTYDPVANVLRQWVVVDPQGYETTISVYNLDTQRKPDPALFTIDSQPVIQPRNN
jgi:outer membrane lipoprotein-sorting protein